MLHALVLASLPAFDFTKGIEGWQPWNDVRRLSASPEGMVIEIGGRDPYVYGPPRDFPAHQALWARLRLRSDQGGAGQLFWFTNVAGPAEERSVHFDAPAGQWADIRLRLPAFEPGIRIRLDPPGNGGKCVVASLVFEARNIPSPPKWPPLIEPHYTDPQTMASGNLALIHDGETFGGFHLNVDGELMALGNDRPMIGYLHGDDTRWVDVAKVCQASTWLETNGVAADAKFNDPDGAPWHIRQVFAAGKPGSIDVTTTVTVDKDRQVVYLPLLTLLPGVSGSGTKKGHALFAGLEYLDDEPSSSEADITGPGAKRQTPDREKLTFPLMAVQADGHYIGLIWDDKPEFQPVFDSPDRLFGYGGHVMSVVFPAGVLREPGSPIGYEGMLLAGGKPLTLHATIIGGKGTSVVPAVEQYVALRGLPASPKTGMDKQGYLQFAAGGWIDSNIRDGDKYRHAYWPESSFRPAPVAGAGVWEEWLARQSADASLAKHLDEAAKAAAALVPPPDYNVSDVAHVRYPVASLLYGHVEENAARALTAGRDLLKRFEPSGSLLYKPTGTDYGKTHFAKDANGYTANVVGSLLEDAVFSGDPDLIRDALRLLRAMDKFAHSAPRGAQTWEVPLHTPDILASAELVRCYTIGYELTGEQPMLQMAKYWAWTGVPFTYLVNPTAGAVGLYATIPVFGATNWTWSWFGLPVQWCGLVYSDALYRLVRHDPNGPWQKLADGITVSGIQQSFPATNHDLQGLLPDSFNLGPQTRNGVAINPGTVEANAIRLFGGPELYDFRSLRKSELLVHAPGEISDIADSHGRASFTVKGWSSHPYYVLIAGLKKQPSVLVNGAPADATYSNGRLVVTLSGTSKIELTTR